MMPAQIKIVACYHRILIFLHQVAYMYIEKISHVTKK